MTKRKDDIILNQSEAFGTRKDSVFLRPLGRADTYSIDTRFAESQPSIVYGATDRLFLPFSA